MTASPCVMEFSVSHPFHVGLHLLPITPSCLAALTYRHSVLVMHIICMVLEESLNTLYSDQGLCKVRRLGGSKDGLCPPLFRCTQNSGAKSELSRLSPVPRLMPSQGEAWFCALKQFLTWVWLSKCGVTVWGQIILHMEVFIKSSRQFRWTYTSWKNNYFWSCSSTHRVVSLTHAGCPVSFSWHAQTF